MPVEPGSLPASLCILLLQASPRGLSTGGAEELDSNALAGIVEKAVSLSNAGLAELDANTVVGIAEIVADLAVYCVSNRDDVGNGIGIALTVGSVGGILSRFYRGCY